MTHDRWRARVLPPGRVLALITLVQLVGSFGAAGLVITGPFLLSEWGLSRPQIGLQVDLIGSYRLVWGLSYLLILVVGLGMLVTGKARV